MKVLRGFGRLAACATVSTAVAGALLLAGCGPDGDANAGAAVTTNVVTVTHEAFVTNVVTVVLTNVVRIGRTAGSGLTVRKTAPYVITTSELSHRQLRERLDKAAARIISVERSAIVEANDRILSDLDGDATLTVRPLDASSKTVRHAETGGRVVVHPLSGLDFDAVVRAVGMSGGEFLGPITISGQKAVLCRLTENSISELAMRPDVWSIERYGK